VDGEVDEFAGRVLGGELPVGLDRLSELPVERLDRVCIRYEGRLDASGSHDRPAAIGVWADQYGATVPDAGRPGANAGWAARSYTLRCERVLVLGRPRDLPGCASSANP
jgi:hypothetical protein